MTPNLMPIQIPRWLIQPEVWRFVGFASTFVGLLFYALSSSFNHLFGEWDLLKICLYSVFSFIICLAILFAKVWQHSTTSVLFKARLAVLVLTATSVYSFFHDKAVNGKPDAYSLISCTAFAIMSFSLSRQIHCGFEVDLLYFFLGCLIVQLMKINLLLVIVGAGFSYSVVILRSSLNAPPESGYIGLQDQVVIQVDSPQATTSSALLITPQQANSGSAPLRTLDASTENGLHGLQDQPHVVIQVDSRQQSNTDSALMMPQLMACIEALEKKNRNLIRMLSKHVSEYLKANVDSKDKDQIPAGQLLTDHNLLIDALPSGIINDLHETVKLMVAAGFQDECCHVYSICRREFLEECLWKLGLQELSIEDVNNRMSIEFRIRRWIKASNVALRILFPNERRLCDRVFFGFSSAADLSFMQVCRELAIPLLNFADTFAIRRRTPNLLCSYLKVFETLRDLIPEFESVFPDQYSVSLGNEAIAIWKRIGEAIRGIFGELENRVRHDPKAAVRGGGLHPVTRYVMNYLRVACRSRQTLDQVFEDYGHPLKEYPKLDDRVASSSSLSVQMHWIMELLDSKLEAKSKIYKDPALCYVFLMNNGRYVVQKAKDSELGTLLGDDWIRKHTAKVRKYRVHYQRSSWNKVLRFLKLDGNRSAALNGAAKSMKEKLKLFSMKFEEICRVQSSWFVFDEQLREEVRISLEKILLPAYGNFIAMFQKVLGKHADEYIKYGLEDIEARLKDLFQGRSGSTGSQKRGEREMLSVTVGEREPTVVVQRISDVDIIDDGYR